MLAASSLPHPTSDGIATPCLSLSSSQSLFSIPSATSWFLSAFCLTGVPASSGVPGQCILTAVLAPHPDGPGDALSSPGFFQ